MSEWALGVLLKPLFAVAFFLAAALIAVAIRPLFAPKLRAVLYDTELRHRHPWRFFFLFAGIQIAVVSAIYWAVT